MTELTPQVTYNDGELRIRSGLADDMIIDGYELIAEEQKNLRIQALENIDTLDGTIVHVGHDSFDVMIDTDAGLGAHFTPFGDPYISDLLGSINKIISNYPDTKVDRVFSLDCVFDMGATGVVYESFQRWLNARGFDEHVARDTACALALPFGKEVVRDVKKSFQYHDEGIYQRASGYTSSIIIRHDTFSFERVGFEKDSMTAIRGKVKWGWVDMATLGSCACWGVSGEDRSWLVQEPNGKRLYEMHPHNVDWARQSLSLLLGIGTMAYAAAKYQGQEDIYGEAVYL